MYEHDIGNELCEKEMSTSQLKFTVKYSNGSRGKRLYGKMISILYRMGENIVVVIHIYGARAVLLLFYDDKNTISTKCEIKMSIYQLIFTY